MNSKILFFLTSISCIGSISAYKTTISNNTDGEIVITETYAGAGVCSPGTRVIGRGQMAIIERGGCCTTMLKAEATTGGAAGKTYEMKPPTTGFGISCMNLIVEVKNTFDPATQKNTSIIVTAY